MEVQTGPYSYELAQNIRNEYSDLIGKEIDFNGVLTAKITALLVTPFEATTYQAYADLYHPELNTDIENDFETSFKTNSCDVGVFMQSSIQIANANNFNERLSNFLLKFPQFSHQ